MKQNTLYTLIVWGLGLFLLTACIDQEGSCSIPAPENGKVQMIMNVRDTSFEIPTTRASADESTVGDIYALVFQRVTASDGFDGTATFKEVVKVINTGTVRILKLEESYPANHPCDILVIANPEDKIYYGSTPINLSGGASAIEAVMSATTTLSDVCTNLLSKPLLKTEISDTKKVPFVVGKKLPMAGVASVSKITNSGTISVDLYRALAKITVKVKDGGITDFTLKGITIIQAPIQGQYWRLNSNLKDNSGTGALIDYYYSGNTNADMLIDADANGSTVDSPIYLYESRKEEEKTAIIIKGEYDGDIGYFKLSIQDDNGTRLDILRNTNYAITITDVNYRGFDNIEDAIKSTNPSLNYTVTSRDQSSHDIVSDGYMYLAFSSSKLELIGPDEEHIIYVAFEIETNSTVSYATNSITVTQGEMVLIDAGENELISTTVEPAGTKTIIRLRLDPGFVNGEIQVKYGSLSHKLEVKRTDGQWFGRAGGIKEITGYYHAELTYPDEGAPVLQSGIYMTPDGVNISDPADQSTSISTYGSFYLHVGPITNFMGWYFPRQIPVYLTGPDNFSGRVKCIIYQSANP